MRTYYRGPDAVVTDGHFIWLVDPVATVPIRHLRHIRLAQCGTQPGHPRGMHVAMGALVVSAAGWTTLGTPAIFVSAPLCATIAAATSLVYWRLRPRRWVLLANYRGAEMTLYASADVRVFNQVARALRRAVEDSRPSAAGYDLVGAA